jgi:hypothetical protein
MSIARELAMQNLRRLTPVFAVLASAAVATGCSVNTPESTLRVYNQSDFAITELHVADVGSASWGTNLLGGDPLYPGESLTLGVDCGTYNVLLIDEQGVDCQVDGVDLCLNDAKWVIHNNTCAVFGAAKAAREAAAKAKASSAGSASPGDAGSR